MKVLLKQFLGQHHSWSVCGWGIAQGLKQLGHNVDLFATDGIKHLPSSLKENLIGYTELNQSEVYGKLPTEDYDSVISYTAMKNFPYYLQNSKKNRFGYWVFEWSGKNVLPTGFAKHYKSCDKLLSPSSFGKQIFMDSGIPENIIEVIPHGIDSNYQNTSTMILPTKKKYKLFANIAQNHKRKNIPGLLDAYGKAFTNKDDVCLILKAKEKPVTMAFEVSLNDCLKNFYNKYPHHAEIKILSIFIEDMSELYRSVNTVFSMTHCEGFYMPALEARASGKLNIVPGWGGQLDLLDNSNALLINGKEERADPSSMYWESKNNAIWFRPSIDDAVDKLRFAYNNYESLNKEIESQREKTYSMYNWNSVTKQILNLCQ